MSASYPIGTLPPLGEVPEKMFAQVVRQDRFGDPRTAFQIEEVDVPPPSAYKPVPPPTTFTPYQAPPKTPTTKSITNTLTITEPKNEQTIWSGSGEFTMSVNLGSALLPGQQLEYLIDGNVVYSGTEASHTFTDIYRGAHVLTVRLSDNSGSSVTSPPVTFYMQRPRKKN